MVNNKPLLVSTTNLTPQQQPQQRPPTTRGVMFSPLYVAPYSPPRLSPTAFTSTHFSSPPETHRHASIDHYQHIMMKHPPLFIPMLLLILVCLLSSTASAQAEPMRDMITLSFTTDYPVLKANLTEFTSISTKTVYDTMSWLLERTDSLHAVTVIDAGLNKNTAGHYVVRVGISFTLHNSQKDNKKKLVEQFNKYRAAFLAVLRASLKDTRYYIVDVIADYKQVPEVCFVVDPRDAEVNVGYYCGTAKNSLCNHLLCLPHYDCLYHSDCMSNSCTRKLDLGEKTCDHIPMSN